MSDPFKPRDLSVTAEEQGLFNKFNVVRTDGSSEPGEKHENCRYFVLDLGHDPYAANAMRAYAHSCELTHPELAKEIRQEFAPDGCCPSNDTMDVFGVKANGETVLIGKRSITPTMKAKELIQEMIGYGNFDDDSSDHAMMLYSFEQFASWLKQRGVV